MGNVIGVDFSYASKLLLDRVYVAVICDSEEESGRVAEIANRNPFIVTHGTPLTFHDDRHRSLCFLYVLHRDLEAAVHLLGQYRSTIRKVALCGSPPTSLLSTLESLLPETVLYNLEHEACLRRGEALSTSLQGEVLAVRGEPHFHEPIDAAAIQKHLHVTVHSGVSYHLCTCNCDDMRPVGNAPIGCSAVVAIFNRFLARHGTEPKEAHVYLPTILDMARNGTTKSCDMLVSNIYGCACEDMGLPGEVIASSFGKLHRFMRSKEPLQTKYSPEGCANVTPKAVGEGLDTNTEPEQAICPIDCKDGSAVTTGESTLSPISQPVPPKEDFAHSLLRMLLISVTQHASLHAQIHGVKSLLFSGTIFEDTWVCILTKMCMEYWSGGTMITHVYRDPMFLAAVGAAELANNSIN